jgi:hypothetical protein
VFEKLETLMSEEILEAGMTVMMTYRPLAVVFILCVPRPTAVQIEEQRGSGPVREIPSQGRKLNVL